MEEIYVINIGDFSLGDIVYHNRCLSASFGGQGASSETIPWELEGNPWDWEYVNGEFVYSPIELPEPPEQQSIADKLADIEEALQILLGGTTG